MVRDNEVKNIVKLVGTTKAIKKAMSELIIEDDMFVFDSFSPLPPELLGTDPGQKIINDENYQEILLDYKDRMDNGELDGFEPVPMSYKIQKKLILNYGYDNWYDWAMNNWGCTTQPYDTTIISDSEFSFFTLLATPHTAMVKMSMKYPKIEFQVRYADEDVGYNVGEYTLLNGETISTNVPPSGIFNKESYLMAYDILRDDYHVREMIYELVPSEVEKAINGRGDKFILTILQAILELELIDEEYPSDINHFLLNSAVNTEQYEYAAKLKKLIDSVKHS